MSHFIFVFDTKEIKMQQAQFPGNGGLKVTLLANKKESIHFDTENITHNEKIFLKKYVHLRT